MSLKRQAAEGAGSPHKPAKRQKRTIDDTDRVQTAAVLSEQRTAGTSSYLSVKQNGTSLSDGNLPTLASSAVNAVVDNFESLFLDANGQVRRKDDDTSAAKDWLALCPPRLASRILRTLLNQSERQPKRPRLTVSAMSELFLNHGLVTSFTLPPLYFRAAQAQYDVTQQVEEDPENILLGNAAKDKRDVAKEQAALRRAGNDRVNLFRALESCQHLYYLNLSGQTKLEDSTLASLLAKLTHLEDLIVRGCTEVGDRSMLAIAHNNALWPRLRLLNLNFAAVTVKGLKSVIARCKSIEILKLDSVNGLTDDAVVSLLSEDAYLPQDWAVPPLSALTNLKLRSTKIGDAGLKAVLQVATRLERLDMSYTKVRSLEPLSAYISVNANAFTKLVLSGLTLKRDNELDMLFLSWAREEGKASKLQTLKLGAMNMPQTPFHDAALQRLVVHLSKFPNLSKISLFGNRNLSIGSAVGLRRFLTAVGRHCDVLDLSGIAISGKLLASGLMDEYEEARSGRDVALRVLLINNAHVNDDIAAAIPVLHNLEELHIEQAKITVECMDAITSSCPRLRVVNLTGCRGIPTAMRRDWFDSYEHRHSEATKVEPKGKRPRR